MRRAMSLLEIVVVLGICTAIMVPVMQLSSRNMHEESELQERCVANGLCLDAMERLKRYKVGWSLPGFTPDNITDPPGPLITEMYMPVELILKRATVFDQAYLAEIQALGMTIEPEVKREEVKDHVGLFKLEVSAKWTNKKGHGQQIKFVRFCYAP